MIKAERVLGQWAEDPRALEGAQALGILEEPRNSNQWASKEFQEFKDEDPRVVAARAAVREARRPDRLFQPGNKPQSMQQGIEYLVK